jgi:hypothetical protein
MLRITYKLEPQQMSTTKVTAAGKKTLNILQSLGIYDTRKMQITVA